MPSLFTMSSLLLCKFEPTIQEGILGYFMVIYQALYKPFNSDAVQDDMVKKGSSMPRIPINSS